MFKKVLELIVAGIIALSSIEVYAMNYPFSPYVVAQAGFLPIAIDGESATWANTFELKKEIPVTLGGGVLINPAYTGDWLLSGELMGHTFVRSRPSEAPWHHAFKEPMIFLLGKGTLPFSEHQDGFFGIGFGGMLEANKAIAKVDTDKDIPKIEPKKAIVFVMEAGTNWHFNNGLYMRGTLRYLKPIIGSAAQDKPYKLSLNGGIQYNVL